MNKFWENLDGTIQTMQAAWGVPGLSVAIVKDDQTVYARGFGVRRQGEPGGVNEHTVFAVGSCTKAFTATAIGMLVQEGKLAWDDLVIQYLPGFQLNDPVATREITVRDLLCHRCGLPTFGGDFMGYGSNYTREEVLARVRYIPPAFHLRAGYGYSNLMYLAAGQIILALTGQPWEEFVRRRLIEPLGMKRTTTGVDELAGMENIAQPHEARREQLFKVPYARLDAHAASGAINSSAWDMAVWLRFQLSNGMVGENQVVEGRILEETRIPHNLIPLDADMRRLIPRRHFAAYGLGWMLSDYAGRLVVSHTGGVDGMLSLAAFLPEEQLGLVILTNRLPASLYSALCFHILDAALGIQGGNWQEVFQEQDRKNAGRQAEIRAKQEEERRTDTHPSLPLEDYTGAYSNPIYGQVGVSLENGQLRLDLGAHPGVHGLLEHWHADTFFCPWSSPVYEESFVHFSIGMQGKAETLRFKVAEFIDPLEYHFQRLPGAPATA
jgi:CubicO group peptidase (beta-lactamase class C family)